MVLFSDINDSYFYNNDIHAAASKQQACMCM